VLNAKADDIVQKTNTFIQTWGREAFLTQSGRQGGPDIIALSGQLDALANSTVIFSRSLFDDDGFLKSHKTYADDMNQVLQLDPNNRTNPLSVLQMSVNGFRDGIRAIELAAKHNDAQLTGQMMQNMRPPLLNLQNGDNVFRSWLDQTRQRIGELRGTLG
jgi:hypothetical protein